MSASASQPKHRGLPSRMGPLVMGGAGFSYQLHPDPQSLPVAAIIKRAFDLGVNAIDTSPYYEPSEQLLGQALIDPVITSAYQREDFVLMTKAGRVNANHFDYSPEWIRKSVERSLERFHTTYLDVVFCHDVEFVSREEAIQAAGILLELVEKGSVRHVGISGYDIDKLQAVARGVRERFGHPVDVVQCWAQLTLQNTQLERTGFTALRDAGVRTVCCSSPLACGLLRSGGVPIGKLGNWHPAPDELRAAAQRAATWVAKQGQTLSALALRFAVRKAEENSAPSMRVTTITGISTIDELESNVQAAQEVFAINSLRDLPHLSRVASSTATEGADAVESSLQFPVVCQRTKLKDAPLCGRVRVILGSWIDYDFSKKAKSSESPRERHGCVKSKIVVKEQSVESRL